MIPEFNSEGLLPPGVHEATWQEVIDRFGATPHRQRLLAGLMAALESLAGAGCQRIYLDGSFVTAKEIPGDFDACWDPTGVNPHLLDPVLLDFTNRRARQKAKFGGELFIANYPADTAGRTFLDFFQIDKDTGNAKGIITLNLRRWKS